MLLDVDARNAILYSYVVLVCLYLIQWFYTAVHQGWCCCRIKFLAIAKSISTVLSALLPWSAQQKPTDFIDECALKHARHRRVKAFAALISYMFKVSVLGATSCIYNIHAGSPRVLAPLQDVIAISLMFVGLLLSVWPHRLLTNNTLDMVYSFLIVGSTVFSCAFDDPNVMALAGTAFMAFRIILLTAYMNVPLVFFWNAVHAACVSAVYCLRFDLGDNVIMNPTAFIFAQIATSTLITALAMSWQKSIHLEMRRELEVKFFKSERSAVGVLLDSVCDVVVELDADLTIIENAPRLSTLLMMSHRQPNQGLTLHQFMVSDSVRQAFKEQLASSTCNSSTPLAGTLHTKMRDSIGNVVDIQVFHVEYAGVDGGRRYVVGIREFADEPVASLRARRSAVAATALSRGQAEPGTSTYMQPTEDSFSEAYGTGSFVTNSMSNEAPPEPGRDWPPSRRTASNSSSAQRSPAQSRGLMYLDQMMQDPEDFNGPPSPRGSSSETLFSC